MRFSYRMVPEVYQVFWAGMAAGEFINDAAVAAGSYRKQGSRWLAAVGGVRPRRGRSLKGRCLTLAQREEIALGRARGDSIRAIAAIIGRSPSTVSRELRRNADGLGRYRATSAHALAYHRASRPKPAKLLTNLGLRGMVEADLAKKYSPEQIAGRLKVDFPDQPEMQVSTETIYQSLYVQSRGALKRDLTRYLRTGRAVRRPSRKVGQRKNRIPNMINIAERPAEADDRAVPGHWEGDLIIGRKNLSAIGTLVERTTNYTMLLHLPDGYTRPCPRRQLLRVRRPLRGEGLETCGHHRPDRLHRLVALAGDHRARASHHIRADQSNRHQVQNYRWHAEPAIACRVDHRPRQGAQASRRSRGLCLLGLPFYEHSFSGAWARRAAFLNPEF